MSEKRYQEKAIPGSINPWGEKIYETGMTLRDWFAGQWLSGTAADPGFGWSECETPVMCQKAYEVADAMMEARKK